MKFHINLTVAAGAMGSKGLAIVSMTPRSCNGQSLCAGTLERYELWHMFEHRDPALFL
jgi:hypothetical protein